MARPLVGLVAHRGVLSGGDARMGHHVTAEAYSRAVARAGGLPIALPLVEPGDIADLLGRVDALVVTGGADVDPSRYGHERDERCGPSDPVRDATDIAFVRAAVEVGLPTLCICRGVQVLNGAESRFPDPGRAVTSSAAGFALPVLPGAWPQGTLTTSVTDPRRGDDFTRTEAFTGAASVTVAVRSGATTDSVAHDFPAK